MQREQRTKKGEPLLFEFKRVNKTFGGHRIFKDLNFSLERGTFSILTGPSGSGKTTLFRMLCGIEQPSDGQIVFLGRKMFQHSPQHLKQIGFVFQHPRGLMDKTVFENVALPLVIDGVQKAEIAKRVNFWLDSLGLRPRAQSLYRELSGGERQKAEFARALIRKPRLILADEPTAHLDSVQADLLLDILWDQYQDGATVFISTHYPPTFHHPKILRYRIADFSVANLESELAKVNEPVASEPSVQSISDQAINAFVEGGF
ncbi:MAG: ftsE [Bacteriovoracaceae bacterium]|nr:ftsE [Bacteriovoracaceae bacterium]